MSEQYAPVRGLLGTEKQSKKAPKEHRIHPSGAWYGVVPARRVILDKEKYNRSSVRQTEQARRNAEA